MTDNTFTRVDLSEFDGIDAAEWYEDVCNYDEDGYLDQPEPNGDVYEAIEDGRLVAHVYMRPAATIIVNAPRFLAALRAAYAENDRLQSQLIAVQEDAMTIYGDNDRLTAEIDRLTKRLAIRDSVAQDYVRAMELMSDDMDRLRASALEWVTVTEDPTTLPEEFRVVLLYRPSAKTGPWEASMRMRGAEPKWFLSVDTSTPYTVDPGDRWAYIPEVPHE